MTVYIPKEELDISGSNLTGSNTTANRSYILKYSDAVSTGFIIDVNDSIIPQTGSYTLSNGSITFLGSMQNSDNIDFKYFIDFEESSTSAKYILTTMNEVRRVAGIGSLYNSDFSDSDIDGFIRDSEAYIFSNYSPILRSIMTVDDQATTAGSFTYKFTPDTADYAVYSVGSLFFEGVPMTEASGVSTGSFTITKQNGKIIFANSNLLNDYDDISIEFIPIIFHKLATYMAAKEILNNQAIITGKDASQTKIDALEKSIEKIEETLRPKGAVMTNSGGLNYERVYKIKNPFDDVKYY